MTKKDYVKFADNFHLWLKANKPENTSQKIWIAGYMAAIETVIGVLRHDNDRFDENKFRKACGL